MEGGGGRKGEGGRGQAVRKEGEKWEGTDMWPRNHST